VKTSEFDYPLPETAIAQTPVEPRDASRLLVVNGMENHHFRDLPRLLDPGDLVVVNDTRVRAARLVGEKVGTGARIEVLLLDRTAEGRWEALVRPARRLRPGDGVQFGPITAEVLTSPQEGRTFLALSAPGDVEAAIEAHGETPLPPYITTTLADPGRYQTVYASRTGSAAAPTAGLHMTTRVLDALRRRSVDVARVELQVGIGTFRPITAENVGDHEMHAERILVPEATATAVDSARRRGGAVVAIGTTVVRTLESRALGPGVEPGEGETSLFITPGHRFSAVDRLVTNFHLPRSSLAVMVAAFLGPEWRQVYMTALERGYRFLSFGDAMLADRHDRRTP
jgi:S-adenosylmethionine:tRNA ribosyltransferase-isomerase